MLADARKTTILPVLAQERRYQSSGSMRHAKVTKHVQHRPASEPPQITPLPLRRLQIDQKLTTMAHDLADTPMLSHTHGQACIPVPHAKSCVPALTA